MLRPVRIDSHASPRPILAYATTCVGVSAVSPIAPVLPELADMYGVSVSTVAWVQAAVLGPGVVSATALMCLAERAGLLRVLKWSLFVYGVFGVSLTLHDNFALAITSRMIQGISGGALVAGSFALVTRLPDARRHGAISTNSALVSLMMVVGPLLGAALGLISPRAPFLIYGVAIALALVVRAHVVRSGDNLRPSAAASKLVSSTIGRHRATALVMGLIALMQLIVFGWLLYLSPIYLAERYGLSVGQRGLVLALQGSGAGVAALWARRSLRAGGELGLLALSLLLPALALLVAAVSETVALDVIAFCVASLSLGVGTPAGVSLMMWLVSTSATGIWQSTSRVGQLLGPLIAAGLVGVLPLDGVLIAGSAIASTGLIGLAAASGARGQLGGPRGSSVA